MHDHVCITKLINYHWAIPKLFTIKEIETQCTLVCKVGYAQNAKSQYECGKITASNVNVKLETVFV